LVFAPASLILTNYFLPLFGALAVSKVHMISDNQEVKLSLSAIELSFIIDYQLADKNLLKKLLTVKQDLLDKRPNFKRVTVCLNLAVLDKLIANISNEANKSNNSTNNQLLLESLFGKLANKYNNAVY
jgi:hypothetical protein